MPKDIAKKNKLDTATAVKNVNKLTLAFAKAAANNQEDKNDNLVVSPYNALTCLAMVAKGAAKNTQEEMAKALFGTDAKSVDAQAEALAALNAEILAANKGQVTLTTANGVWINKEQLAVNKKFAGELKKVFGAEISEENFSDKSVPAKINSWADANTNHLIDNIVEKLEKDDFAILASALYFKGDWTHEFDKKETKNLAFTADDGTVSTTPTMHKFFKEGEVHYQTGSDYEAIALTYGQEDYQNRKYPTMRLVLIRPTDENTQARDWLAQQAGNAEAAWLNSYSFESVQGTVELPRMDIKQKHDLIPALKEMGIRDAFEEGIADFSPMTEAGSKDLLINKVSHDVVFKTDEKGSEAAAVTTVGMVFATSIRMPQQTINIKFDRSFVFALQDIKTGAVIFAGAVNRPNKDMTPKSGKERRICNGQKPA